MSAVANATRSEYWTGQLEWMRPNPASVKPNTGCCAEPVTGQPDHGWSNRVVTVSIDAG